MSCWPRRAPVAPVSSGLLWSTFHLDQTPRYKNGIEAESGSDAAVQERDGRGNYRERPAGLMLGHRRRRWPDIKPA